MPRQALQVQVCSKIIVYLRLDIADHVIQTAEVSQQLAVS
jgi:hypothetical protein